MRFFESNVANNWVVSQESTANSERGVGEIQKEGAGEIQKEGVGEIQKEGEGSRMDKGMQGKGKGMSGVGMGTVGMGCKRQPKEIEHRYRKCKNIVRECPATPSPSPKCYVQKDPCKNVVPTLPGVHIKKKDAAQEQSLCRRNGRT